MTVPATDRPGGFMLMESVLALLLFAIVGTALMTALNEVGRMAFEARRESVLARLAGLAVEALPAGHRHPLTLRYRLGDATRPAEAAEATVRFKLILPRSVIAAGTSAVTDLSGRTVAAFQSILRSTALQELVLPDD